MATANSEQMIAATVEPLDAPGLEFSRISSLEFETVVNIKHQIY